MPRYFTLAEAEKALPEVEQALRDVLFHRAEYQKAHDDVENNTRRIRMAGGSRVDPGAHLALRARRDTSAAALVSRRARKARCAPGSTLDPPAMRIRLVLFSTASCAA